jgi:hypothetical protein
MRLLDNYSLYVLASFPLILHSVDVHRHWNSNKIKDKKYNSLGTVYNTHRGNREKIDTLTETENTKRNNSCQLNN